MNLAPLQLMDYWVENLFVQVNPDYNQDEPDHLDFDLFHLEPSVTKDSELGQDGNLGTHWKVGINLCQKIGKGKNIPYAFGLKIVGDIIVHPSLDGAALERAVQVNGPAMLFGAARDIIRSATGRGPYAPVLLPSVNFLHRAEPSDSRKSNASGVEKGSTEKKLRKKKRTRLDP